MSSIPPGRAVAPPPAPDIRPITTIKRPRQQLTVALERLDTGLQYVSLAVYHVLEDGTAAEEPRRRINLRLEDVEAVSDGLLRAMQEAGR